jgi:hypothetical protein
MLQRSSLPTTSPAEIADSLQRTFDGPLSGSFGGRRWQAVQDVLPMPSTWQQYILACLALTIVVGGMWLQVLLSVQIARSEFTLRQMRSEYARVERQNSELIYAISQQSSLAHMAELATRSGYVPATGRTYVVRGQDAAELPAALAPESAALNPVPAPNRFEPALDWLDQTHQWWQNLQQSVSTASGQLWRDITGRME